MPNYQNKPFVAESQEQVFAAYPCPNPAVLKSVPAELVVSLLGDATKPGFEEQRVVSVDISSFGLGKYKWLKVNRALVEPFTKAMEQISQVSRKLNYVIRELGGQFFRYRNYTDTIASVKNGEHYMQTAKPWGEKAGRVWNSEWNVIAAEYDAAMGCLNPRLLSNHARGSAIDINWSENGLNAATFDMPPEIVTIMAKCGFTWGGYYKISGLDAMHFEYNLPYVDSAKLFFPLSNPSKRESPIRQYGQNERGAGGFFPISLSRTLHGGVHLKPEPGSKKEIYCPMPGVVVAMRLVASGKGDDNALVNEFTGGGNLGFVLVQHWIIPTKQKDGRDEPDPDNKFPIYSIYMHLASPTWGGDDGYAKNVPWVKKLLSFKNGAVVSLDAARPDTLGKTYAGKTSIQPTASSFQAEQGLTFEARRKNKVIAVGKGMPQDVGQAIEALKAGATVTFDKPALPVAAGELIGYAESFIHWEIFSPEGAGGGIAKLLKIDAELGALFTEVQEAKNHENNYLEVSEDVNELRSILFDPLPADDKAAVADVVDDVAYQEDLKRFFNGGARFANEKGRSDDAKTRDVFTYPLKITLLNDLGYRGGPSGTSDINVKFSQDGKVVGKTGKMTLSAAQLKQDKFDVVIFVPDQADTMVLTSPDLMLEVQAPLDPKAAQKAKLEMFKDLISTRWRHFALTHVNEWTPKGLGLLLDTLNKEEPFRIEAYLAAVANEPKPAIDALKRKLRGITWWNRAKSANDPFGEVPVLGAQADEKSLFGSASHLLPVDGKITCLHPITALWLVDLLLDRRKLSLVDQWPEFNMARAEDLDEPVFLGWASASDPVRLGETVHAMLVQHGFGSGGDVIFSVTPQSGGKPLVLNDTPVTYEQGVAQWPVIGYSFWGNWKLSVKAKGRDLAPKDVSQASLNFEKPVLASSSITIASNAITATLLMQDKCPAALQGFAFVETTTETPGPDTKGSMVAVALPILAATLLPEKQKRSGIVYEGDMITGFDKGKAGPVTTSFKIEQYAEKYAGDSKYFKIALPLCQRVQAMQDACKVNGKVTVTATVVSVGIDGLSVIVKPTKGVTADFEKLKSGLEGLPASPLFSFSQVEGQEHLALTYKPNVNTGTLVVTFDAGLLLGGLLEGSGLKPGQKLSARPRVIFPRGGHSLAAAPPRLSPTKEVSIDAIKSACDNDFFEVTTTQWLPPVAVLGFGELTYSLGDRSIVVEVELLGDMTKWSQAKPSIKLQAGSYTKSAGKINGTRLIADFAIATVKDNVESAIKDVWGKSLTFTVEPGDPAKLGGVKPPPPAALTLEAKPVLDTYEVTEADGVLTFKGQAKCMPTGRNLVIICEKQGANGVWADDTKITAKVKYTIKAGTYAAGWCSPSGAFEATLRLADLNPAMSSASTYRFAWRRVSTSGQVWGIAVAEKVAPYTPST